MYKGIVGYLKSSVYFDSCLNDQKKFVAQVLPKVTRSKIGVVIGAIALATTVLPLVVQKFNKPIAVVGAVVTDKIKQ